MCTCGIDMATQQPTPATISSHCNWRGVKGECFSGVSVSYIVPSAAIVRGGGVRSKKASGTIVAMQTMPMIS